MEEELEVAEVEDGDGGGDEDGGEDEDEEY